MQTPFEEEWNLYVVRRDGKPDPGIHYSIIGGKKVVFKSLKIKEGLNFIKELIEKGSFRPVIDRKYPLDKIAEAFQYVMTGQKIGNVIITMNA